MKNLYFRKHIDYSSENEYRFMSFSENKYDYIDINNCCLAIIISKMNLEKFQRKYLVNYASELNIDVFFIRWNSSGIVIESYDEFLRDIEIEENVFGNTHFSS